MATTTRKGNNMKHIMGMAIAVGMTSIGFVALALSPVFA